MFDLPAAIFQAFSSIPFATLFVCPLCCLGLRQDHKSCVALSLSLTQGMACIGDITVCSGRWADVQMDEACTEKITFDQKKSLHVASFFDESANPRVRICQALCYFVLISWRVLLF